MRHLWISKCTLAHMGPPTLYVHVVRFAIEKQCNSSALSPSLYGIGMLHVIQPTEAFAPKMLLLLWSLSALDYTV